MKSWLGALFVLAAAIGAPITAAPPQQAVFRAGTDIVVFDAAVRRNDKPVMGLTADDFAIADNGVPQTIDDVKAEVYPIDLTMVVDKTTGVIGGQIDHIQRAVVAVAHAMTANDTVRLITFDERIRKIYAGAPGNIGAAIATIEADGHSSLYDAVAASLMRPRDAGRRSLVVVLTAGQDSASTISPATLMKVAKRADVVLDVFFAYNESSPTAGRQTWEFNDRFKTIRDVAHETGGLMDDMLGDDHVVQALESALVDFKSRYLISYTIRNVPRAGWHDITITLKHPNGAVILARHGYDGGK